MDDNLPFIKIPMLNNGRDNPTTSYFQSLYPAECMSAINKITFWIDVRILLCSRDTILLIKQAQIWVGRISLSALLKCAYIWPTCTLKITKIYQKHFVLVQNACMSNLYWIKGLKHYTNEIYYKKCVFFWKNKTSKK